MRNSLTANDDVEEQRFNAKANNVNNSQEAIQVINRYKDIIKAQIKKKQQGILINKENFYKSLKILISFSIMLVQADQRYILKFHYISY